MGKGGMGGTLGQFEGLSVNEFLLLDSFINNIDILRLTFFVFLSDINLCSRC